MALTLKPVDRIEVTVVIDNSLDVLMSSTPVAERAKKRKSWADEHQLRAEHGVALLIRAHWGGQRRSVILDAGSTTDGAVHNFDALDCWPDDLEAIVISHGHTDHTGGLVRLLERLNRPGLPVILHPDALRRRKTVHPGGETEHIQIDQDRVRALGADLQVREGPSLLLDGHLLVSGEIGRVTEFEHGIPTQFVMVDGDWVADPSTRDDQAVIANVRDQGLVVLTGCGHAGVVNTLLGSRELTAGEPIHALLGGFHLTGNAFEKIIDPTVAALDGIRPDYIVPMHCTGWKATHQLATAMPGAFVPTSVGTTFSFAAPGPEPTAAAGGAKREARLEG